MAKLLVLLALLFAGLFAAGAARAELHRADTPHFTIQADLPELAVRKLAGQLETIDALMRTLSGPLRTNRAKAWIFVVPDIDKARGLIGLPGFTGGITMNTDMGEIIVVSGDPTEQLGLRRSLFHEYAHSFMSRYLGSGLPGWFVEGSRAFSRLRA